MKKAILMLGILFVVVGCKQKNSEDSGDYSNFIEVMTNEGAYVGGSSVIAMDEDIHQVSINVIRKTYRLQTDDMSQCLMMSQLSELSQMGQKGQLLVISVGSFALGSKSYSVEVVQDKDGKVWLWDGSAKVGFVMPKF